MSGFGNERKTKLRQGRVGLIQPWTLDLSEWDETTTLLDVITAPSPVEGYAYRPNSLRGNVLSITRLMYVSEFPYEPGDPEVLGRDFTVNGGFDISPRGSAWEFGQVEAPKAGLTGDPGEDDLFAWSLPLEDSYLPDTTAWLVSPIFDLSSLTGSGFVFGFQLWMQGDEGDAFKVQVSTDGGLSWSDAVTNIDNNVTSPQLADRFGGSSAGFSVSSSGDSFTIVETLLAPHEGNSDIRFRLCFAASLTSSGTGGIVVKGLRIGVTLL